MGIGKKSHKKTENAAFFHLGISMIRQIIWQQLRKHYVGHMIHRTGQSSRQALRPSEQLSGLLDHEIN
jgi:hypothetical protein